MLVDGIVPGVVVESRSRSGYRLRFGFGFGGVVQCVEFHELGGAGVGGIGIRWRGRGMDGWIVGLLDCWISRRR